MRYILHTKVKIDTSETRHLYLCEDTMKQGCELLMNSATDTCVAGKRAWISEVIEGVVVSARGISDSLPIKEIVHIVCVMYAYDRPDTGDLLLLQINHCITRATKR